MTTPITDYQIRELRDRAYWRIEHGAATQADRETHAICESALNESELARRYREARERCAVLYAEMLAEALVPVTAETITRGQIADLMRSPNRKVVKKAKCALGLSRGGAAAERAARAFCVGAHNASANLAGLPDLPAAAAPRDRDDTRSLEERERLAGIAYWKDEAW